MVALGPEAPDVIVLENVVGVLTSHGGRDFAAIIGALSSTYRVGALVIDAARFLPQSRARLFVVAARAVLERLASVEAMPAWSSASLRSAVDGLPLDSRARWVWWALGEPEVAQLRLRDVLEAEPTAVRWHSPEQTRRLLDLMAPTHLARVLAAPSGSVGAVYRRMRPAPDGSRAQRAEVRFDGVAGCLRTGIGGSSRQKLLFVDRVGDLGSVRSRLLSPREAARLMGVPDAYPLPSRPSTAYHLLGDAVAVPVVRWLADRLFAPLVSPRVASTACVA